MNKYLQNNEQTKQVYIALFLLQQHPMNEEKLIKQIQKLKNHPPNSLQILLEHLSFLACYAKNKTLQLITAEILDKQTQPIYIHLHICKLLEKLPEQQITTNVNLVLINPDTPLKYRSLPPQIEITNSGKRMTLGWEIDEIVQFRNSFIPNWQFWNFRLQAGGSKLGLPVQFCRLGGFDIIQNTILDEFIDCMSYSGGFIDSQKAMEFSLKVLGMKCVEEMYERYIQYFLSSDIVENYVLGAQHCLIQIADGILSSEYWMILSCLTKRLNQEIELGVDKSFELQQIFKEIVQINPQQKVFDLNLIYKFYDIQESLQLLRVNFKNLNETNLVLILRNICEDGRLQVLEQFFNIIITDYAESNIIYTDFLPLFQNVQQLLSKYNFKQIFSLLLTPLTKFYNDLLTNCSFTDVKTKQNFNENISQDIKLQINPFKLITLLSVTALLLQSTHNRTNDMIQWFQPQFQLIRTEFATFLSKIKLINEQFKSQADKKLSTHVKYSEIQTVFSSLNFSIEYLISTLLETPLEQKNVISLLKLSSSEEINFFEFFQNVQLELNYSGRKPENLVETAAIFTDFTDNVALLKEFKQYQADCDNILHQVAKLRVFKYTQEQDVLACLYDQFDDKNFQNYKEQMLKNGQELSVDDEIQKFYNNLPMDQVELTKTCIKLLDKLNLQIESNVFSTLFLAQSLDLVQKYLRIPAKIKIFNRVIQTDISQFQQEILSQLGDLFSEEEKIACYSCVDDIYKNQVKIIFNL